MALEKKYNWLLDEDGPIMVKEALKLLDTIQGPGDKNNPTIIKWASEINCNIEHIYLSDEIPWCGLFMAIVAKRSAKEIVKDPLWALNWGNFGKYIENPMLGDILVFTRPCEEDPKKICGHVGIYVGEDEECYHVLGGNQNDCVCITRKEKSRLYISRRPNYSNQPKNIRKIIYDNNGVISYKEK
jgi:uncharacterized protein (TIGR02594 family)